ncbi:MAG: hypothetical protein ACE5IK_00115 [Acidobacteriota bacterium]
MQFFYIYKALAHPEYNDYVTPFTLDERLMHVHEAKRTLGSKIPWLCDGMSNDVKHSLGNAPNAEFVVGPDGRIARRRLWSNPSELRKDLEALVGKVEHPTRVEDLDMPAPPPREGVATGIVPGVEVPGRMRALKIEPVIKDDGDPFYVKLRAEADESFLEKGTGKLFLGFRLDPLYHVHWNNRADPLEFTVKAASKVTVSPSQGRAPVVEAAADADPREFLIDVSADERDRPLDLSVRYFACDDANTFCVPVTQNYRIDLETDPDGGAVMSRLGGGGARSREELIARIKEWDADGDGKIVATEVPGPMRGRFDSMDANSDGALDGDEIGAMADRMLKMMGGRRGRPRPTAAASGTP